MPSFCKNGSILSAKRWAAFSRLVGMRAGRGNRLLVLHRLQHARAGEHHHRPHHLGQRKIAAERLFDLRLAGASHSAMSAKCIGSQSRLKYSCAR